MSIFEYTGASPRVIFGKGILAHRLPAVVENLGVKAAMILSTPEQTDVAKRVEQILGGVAVSYFSGAVMHTPNHVTETALSQTIESGVDGIISVGGGSTIGLGKAISIRVGLPHLCVPTTYAGSEMTPILRETENGRKVTQRDPRILPNAVVYDVELTMTLPVKLSVNSGINALAHAVEALYATNTNPIINLMACEGIKSMSEALPTIQRDGSFDLPHAETHVAVLPHALAFNAIFTRPAMTKLAAALPESNGNAVMGINALYSRLGIKVNLRTLGMPEDGIDKAADMAVLNPYQNPRPLERDALCKLIRRAWSGEPAFQDF